MLSAVLRRGATRAVLRRGAAAPRGRAPSGSARVLSAVPSKAPPAAGPPEFVYQDLFEQTEAVDVPYRKLEGSEKWVSTVAGPKGLEYVSVAPEALTALTKSAMTDIAHLLRPAHLQQLSGLLGSALRLPGIFWVPREVRRDEDHLPTAHVPQKGEQPDAILLLLLGDRILAIDKLDRVVR